MKPPFLCHAPHPSLLVVLTWLFSTSGWAAIPTPLASQAAVQASADPRVSHLKDIASSQKLGWEAAWTRILFYVPSLMHGRKGLIDDPDFYLSPVGKFDPSAELHATIEAFFTTPLTDSPDRHPLCRFPARRAFIEQRLGVSPATWPHLACPKYEEWAKGRRYVGMSMVFSSYYPDNPASMFGHIFLRFHRPGTSFHSDLLDDIVNFAAFPDTENPLLYNFKGAFGGFPGRFSLVPYYLKIQEYNNIESRDLWEYAFDASRDQVDRIVQSLWEFGPHFTNYYYFDRNCAFVLLVLLETGDPNWHLIHPHAYWSTPSASLKSLAHGSKLFKARRFRASAMSRYHERFDDLSTEEAALLGEVIKQEGMDPLMAAQPNIRRVAVVDTALEYIDYTEKLGGMRRPEHFAHLRDRLLALRLAMPKSMAHDLKVPDAGDPAQGHPDSWAMLGVARRYGRTQGFLRWQPVLHDLLSDDTGYAKGMQIQIMPMEVDYDLKSHHVWLEQLDFLNVLSLNAQDRLLTPKSWSLRLGWERQKLASSDGQIRTHGFLETGRGVAYRLGLGSTAQVITGFLLQGSLGGFGLKQSLLYAQIGPDLFMAGSLGAHLRILMRSRLSRRWMIQNAQIVTQHEVSSSLSLSKRLSLRGSLRREDIYEGPAHLSAIQGDLGLVYFF